MVYNVYIMKNRLRGFRQECDRYANEFTSSTGTDALPSHRRLYRIQEPRRVSKRFRASYEEGGADCVEGSNRVRFFCMPSSSIGTDCFFPVQLSSSITNTPYSLYPLPSTRNTDAPAQILEYGVESNLPFNSRRAWLTLSARFRKTPSSPPS